MNHAPPIRRRSVANPQIAAPADFKASTLENQARALDATFKALARRVLIDNDSASEMPLRQFRVCAALFEGARSMKQLSRELGVSQSAVTQIADRLEAAGMVKRGAVGEDRRVKNLELTGRARKLLQLREERRIARVSEILKNITAQDRKALLVSLEVLKSAADEDLSNSD